jgi:U4/U6.U5 tri-snRNP-associated protein 2
MASNQISEFESDPSNDLYLDTVNRSVQDFDLEKQCSVSLNKLNVYACLVCGKYFQGRGKSSHAYTHSLHENHHVFVNLQTLKFYILPDSYEVTNSTLDDIKYAINPTFTQEIVKTLDTATQTAHDLSHKEYVPGLIGLNNIKANDYTNSVIQLLSHVPPLRDFFLLKDFSLLPDIVKSFSLLLRKMWSSKSFKGQVFPHEFLLELHERSGRAFKITDRGDPAMVLKWLLNTFRDSIALEGKRNLIESVFQGSLAVVKQKLDATFDENGESSGAFDYNRPRKTTIQPFLMLALELPPQPLFQDAQERNIIPQIALSELLEKYSGKKLHKSGNYAMTYRIKALPRYLLIHIKRFVKNSWSAEKNPTIINYDTCDLDLAAYADLESSQATKYNLIANLVHEGKIEDGEGSYKCHVFHKPSKQWFSIHDLHVERILPHMVLLAESYIQVWERQDQIPRYDNE